MTTTTTTQELTAEQKAAYNKGWASTAKSQMLAINSFAKKEADADLQRLFSAGYVDKHNGSTKWDSVNALQLEAESEGEIVRHEDAAGLAAVLRVVPETEEAAAAAEDAAEAEADAEGYTEYEPAEAAESDEDLAAEAAAPAEAAVPAEADLQGGADAPVWFPEGGVLAPKKGKLFTTIPQLRARITKGMDRAEVRAIRDEIGMKKRHYLMGWNSFLSPLFKGDHDVAEAGYYKRHGAPDANAYWADWEAGWQDAAKGRAKGHAWA